MLSNNAINMPHDEIMKMTSKMDIMKKCNFITEQSKDINKKFIIYAMLMIDRGEAVAQIANMLMDIKKAISIEMSIFEYALLHVTLHSLSMEIITPIYIHKYEDILMNLDKNSYVANKTLYPFIMNENVNLQYVAFLSPLQLHPEAFANDIEKIKKKEDAISSMATSNAHFCKNCKERKTTVYELQIRSSDEPSSYFITCMVCYRTWII